MTDSQRRFYLCVTCGRLKADELFKQGECTCDDCQAEGRSNVRFRKAEDGDGWVYFGGAK